MASVLIITTILNIVVSVLVHSQRQPLLLFSPNEQLRYNDQKDVDRRMDTVPGGHQVRREELNSNMVGNEWLKNRDKRAILYLVNQRTAPEALFRMPKTTQNPFIRETNIDDYDIGGPADGEHVQTSNSGSDIDSHQLVSETSDVQYESGYTISMSDSEDWDNYPLTTPSGPNPGWRLSTLADIYQRQRVKRSPKQKKRKIGAYKEKLKERRKRKNMRTKMRIIRNSKEDKEVLEDLKIIKDEEMEEKVLIKPWYQQKRVQKDSKKALWSNETHRIVEDKGATFKRINKTHYTIFKENATDDWFNKEHVLVYDEDYEFNSTIIEESLAESSTKHSKTTDVEADYSEDYNEEFTKEDEEEHKKYIKRKENTKNEIQNENKNKNKEIKPNTNSDIKRNGPGAKKDKSDKNAIKNRLGWENQIEDNSESKRVKVKTVSLKLQTILSI